MKLTHHVQSQDQQAQKGIRNDMSCMPDVEEGGRRSRRHARQGAEETKEPSEAVRGGGVGRLPQQSHPPPHKLVQRLSVKNCVDEGRLGCLQNDAPQVLAASSSMHLVKLKSMQIWTTWIRKLKTDGSTKQQSKECICLCCQTV